MRQMRFSVYVALVLAVLIALPDKAASQRQLPQVRLGTDLVSLVVTVADSHGQFVSGLAQDQFEVFDNQVKQRIAHFSATDMPISLGILYDVSGSMTRHIDQSLRALKRFIETSHEDDDFFLITFNSSATLAQDFTTSAERLVSHLNLATPRGRTAFYDAVYLGVEKLKQGRHAKRALLILSDGLDNHSGYTFKELRHLVQESDVQIYAIGSSDFFDYGGRRVLEEVAEMSGGRAFFVNVNKEAELTEVCTRIALELRHQYSIGFYPTNVTGEGSLHKLKVRVRPPAGTGPLRLFYKENYPSFNRRSIAATAGGDDDAATFDLPFR